MGYLSKLSAMLALGLLASFPAIADSIIDPFTAQQGPFRLGPGEILSEEQAIVRSGSILGGFRVGTAVINEDAAPGSEVTFAIGGGELLCDLSFSVVDEDNSSGGCGLNYPRGRFYFDLSEVSSFDFNVLEISSLTTLAITIVDGNETVAIGVAELNSTGPLRFARDQFFSPLDVDWARIEGMIFGVGNTDGLDTRIRLGAISTTGSIQSGEPGPEPALPDEVLSDTISGNFFNPDRDGEGCMLTREADETTFILTCYFYDEGEQFWIIGNGQLRNGEILFTNMVITRGAEYGAAFDPASVETLPFGSVTMQFADCNEAMLRIVPVAAGFPPADLPMQRIIPVNCNQGVPSPRNARSAGTWYNPSRDGEGFQLAVEGDEDVHVLTFYTYLNGEQVWMIGPGTRAGNSIEFDVIVTRGTGFGSQFNPAEVQRTPFGKITMDFEDCNTATVRTNSVLQQFPNLETEVVKIVPGPCEP